MLPKYHIIYGIVFSISIFLIFPSIGSVNALIIFLSSVLIDIDHYLCYVYKKKNFSLKKAYAWFKDKRKPFYSLPSKEREKYKRGIIIFHGIEFFLILIFLLLFKRLFLFILLGVSFHIILDFIDYYMNKEKLRFKISQIYVFFFNKGKEEFEIEAC